MPNSKILIVEDDPAVNRFIRNTLDTQDYSYHTASNGNDALSETVSYCPDVIILDLGLPDMDGVEVIKKIRDFSSVPIVVASARMEDKDKVEALDAGADDYLTKPFSIEEFISQIKAALSKDAEKSSAGDVYINGGLRIEYATKCVYLDEQEVRFAPMEYRLLCLLAENAGKILTGNFILKKLGGKEGSLDTPSLRMYMATLRKKIEPDVSAPKYIQTHIGVGYRLRKN